MLEFEALTMLFLGCGHLLCDKSLSCTNPMVFFSPMNISQLKSLKKKKKNPGGTGEGTRKRIVSAFYHGL